MMWDGAPITAIKRTFVRHADDCGLPNFTPGTIRHFVATMVRRQKPPVDKEQTSGWGTTRSARPTPTNLSTQITSSTACKRQKR